MRKTLFLFILIAVIATSCSKEETNKRSSVSNDTHENGWLVPFENLRLSQTGKDRIPSIDNPIFTTSDLVNLNPNDIVYAFRIADTIKVYPQDIISGHEIVNDKIGSNYFCISYCPLTGSALSWNRNINGSIAEFGVSGHLYNDNLISYDRNTNSMWSQMTLTKIKGNTGDKKLVPNMLLKTKWSTITKSFSNVLVLIDSSDYLCYDSICFPYNHRNSHKEATVDDSVLGYNFGIVNNEISAGGFEALLLNYENFTDSITVINTYFRNHELIIVGSRYHQFITAFINEYGDNSIEFSPLQDRLPNIFMDNIGNIYDITGLIVSGPNKGKSLSSPISYWAHSTAWKAFFSDEIETLEN